MQITATPGDGGGSSSTTFTGRPAGLPACLHTKGTEEDLEKEREEEWGGVGVVVRQARAGGRAR